MLLDNAEKSLHLEKDRFKNGLSSALYYRMVQLEYINAQFSRLEEIYELLINEIDILKLTGGLRPKHF